MSHRVINFSAGPAALPLWVLERIKADIPDYNGTGMAVMEMSHRSAAFDGVMDNTISRLSRLMKLNDDYQPLFIQGGASMQFAMIPMNLCGDKRPAFVDTGTWSTKAIQQAEKLGFNPNVIADSKDRNFSYIPKGFEIPSDAAYLHLVSNNTIKGTQYKEFPKTDLPIICDMSSDILSRPVDVKPFGLIFAGAQKNLGPSGVCVVIIRKDMLERKPHPMTPIMLDYSTYASKNSMYNTPPTFAIYVVGLVLEWIETQAGGLEGVAETNRQKAEALYGYMDSSGGYYKPTADTEDRSAMNVTFRLGNEDLEKAFVAEAAKNGLLGLKGHRSVGGCRASTYNAISLEQINTLVSFMKEFAAKNG